MKRATWQLLIVFQLVVKYIILRTSHFWQTSQAGVNSTEPGGFPGIALNMSFSGKKQEHRHQLVHSNAANAATNNMTQDAHLNMVHKTESRKN
jgi:hypothetical protein